ncbi:hypothetical protein HZC53_05230 [Candidatus Uhrbacteria bacterium]|nr:hypothetical protein [Candidatus Uhrbacteria bacterium]
MGLCFKKTTRGMALAFILLSLPAAAFAHDPRFVREEKVVEVSNPEISQAFYGWLDGQAVLYKIKTDVPQELYFQLLVPDVPGVMTDLKAELKAHGPEGVQTFVLDGDKANWQRWYEEYGGEWYLKGPEMRQSVGTGTQTVFISNADLYGSYVFVVGEKEAFPLDRMIATVKLLPKLHQEFFLKPWYSSFFNRIGLFLAVPLIILAVLAVGAFLLYRHSQQLLRRAILVCFGGVLAILAILAVRDMIGGNWLGRVSDLAVLFACLAGFTGLVWAWARTKHPIRPIEEEMTKNDQP